MKHLIHHNGHLINGTDGLVLNYEYVPPPTPTMTGWTFKAASDYPNGFNNIDFAGGVVKHYNLDSYYKDLTTNTSGALSEDAGVGNDQISFPTVAGNIYQVVWGEQDLQQTFGNAPRNRYISVINWQNQNIFNELYSIDFWKFTQTDGSMSTLTVIPSAAEDIFNGEYLSFCNGLYKNSQPTHNIEPCITALSAACPNLTWHSECFAGCTSAPDYQYCLETYPTWF